MMGFHDGDWTGGGWLAMSSMMLLFWAVVIALVVWAVRSFSERQHPDSDHTNAAGPDDILAERYARGEIDDDEFQHRRDLLRSKSDSGPHTRSTP
jgi:putative membrane protein